MYRALAIHSSGKSRDQRVFILFWRFFIDKTARSSASFDGSQLAGLNTAIESLWRCIFVDIRPFLWCIMAPWRSLGFQGRPWGVSGTSLGLPGACLGVPGASPRVPGVCPGVPGACLGVPGACPGDFRDPRGLRGRPRHPRDHFRKDDSVL